MTLPGLPLVLAEGITADQLRQLAAVMLGLVVFAAVFVLVARQRARRGGDDEATPPPFEEGPAPPAVEYPAWTPPPPHAGTAPALSEGEIQDELPVPFVPRGHEPAPAKAAPSAPAGAAPPAAARPEVAAPEAEPQRATTIEPDKNPPPPLDHRAEGAPESPAEIGIIIPDEAAGPGKAGEGKAGEGKTGEGKPGEGKPGEG